MPLIEVPESPSGMDLKFARMRARITQQTLSEAMHRTRSTVSDIERAIAPSPDNVRAYLEALQRATTGDVATLEKAG